VSWCFVWVFWGWGGGWGGGGLRVYVRVGRSMCECAYMCVCTRVFLCLCVFVENKLSHNTYVAFDLKYLSLHRYEYGPPKFFSKTFKNFIIFFSTLQISRMGHYRKVCRCRKKGSKPSEITFKQSERARTISKIEKRKEFVQGLCIKQFK